MLQIRERPAPGSASVWNHGTARFQGCFDAMPQSGSFLVTICAGVFFLFLCVNMPSRAMRSRNLMGNAEHFGSEPERFVAFGIHA